MVLSCQLGLDHDMSLRHLVRYKYSFIAVKNIFKFIIANTFSEAEGKYQ